MTPAPCDITLAVLAGGEGSRMGRPKGALRIGGRPILQYLLERFAWPGPALLVTAPGREHPPAWERFGREVSDPLPGEGPLRGLLTALEACRSPWLLATTVDMPAVGPDQLQWLVATFAASLPPRPALLGLMTRRTGSQGEQVEPFPSLFVAEAAGLVRGRLGEGARSVFALSRTDHVLALPAPPEWPARTWTNLNRPEDLEQFERENRQLA